MGIDAKIERLTAEIELACAHLVDMTVEKDALTAQGKRKDDLLSQLYQIIGSMADDLGKFDEPKMQRLLTEIHEPTGQQFLPWPSLAPVSGSPTPCDHRGHLAKDDNGEDYCTWCNWPETADSILSHPLRTELSDKCPRCGWIICTCEDDPTSIEKGQ